MAHVVACMMWLYVTSVGKRLLLIPGQTMISALYHSATNLSLCGSKQVTYLTVRV